MALRLAGEGYAEGGVTEFLGLSDTPGSYSGEAGKYAKVHAAENALEFDTPSGGGDMLKSVYDIDGDGIVDNAEKLEGSTKAQVQDHDPKAHAASHQDGGADEISVAGLSGELADLQKPKDHTHQSLGGGVGGKLDHGLALDGLGDDDHAQYLNTSRHDTTERHPLGTVVPHDALANLTERAHSSLTGIGASDHHEKTVDASELTTGNLPAARLGGILTTQGDVLIRDATGPTRLGAGTDGQFLKTQGAGANPVWADAGGGGEFDIFSKYIEFIPWVSLDGFTIGGDASPTHILARCFELCVETEGGAADHDAFVYGNAMCRFLAEAGKKTTFEFPIYNLDYNTLQNIWIRFATGHNDPPSEIQDHFGWKIINGDLYSSTGDGSTQTIKDTGVDLPGYTPMRKRLKIVLTPGTDCKFYVDDVLKTTHSSEENLPDYHSFFFHIHVRTLTTVYRNIQIGRVLIEKEY